MHTQVATALEKRHVEEHCVLRLSRPFLTNSGCVDFASADFIPIRTFIGLMLVHK